MLRIPLPLAALALTLAACGDETLTAYGAADKTWQLAEIDGVAFTENAEISFPEPGRIAGHTLCNSLSGAQTAPYPWFEATGMAVTERACPGLEAEAQFLQALIEMREAEVAGDVLILRNEAGREMVFTAGG